MFVKDLYELNGTVVFNRCMAQDGQGLRQLANVVSRS